MKKTILATALALLSMPMTAQSYDAVKGAASVSAEWYCHEFVDTMLDVRDLLRKGASYGVALQTADQTRLIRNGYKNMDGIRNQFINYVEDVIWEDMQKPAAVELSYSDLMNINADTLIRQTGKDACHDSWNDAIATNPGIVDAIIYLQTN